MDENIYCFILNNQIEMRRRGRYESPRIIVTHHKICIQSNRLYLRIDTFLSIIFQAMVKKWKFTMPIVQRSKLIKNINIFTGAFFGGQGFR